MKNRLSGLAQLSFFLIFFSLVLSLSSFAFAPKREYYEIKLYHLKDKEQEDRLDTYLRDAYLPALHRKGIRSVGVFKPVGNDTAADRRTYVFIPYKSLDEFLKITDALQKDKDLQSAGSDYINSAFNNPSYLRMETILLEAFPDHPVMSLPKLTGAKSERVYELRSYESASEKLHQNKVQMFNQGGEVKIFDRLGFNPVFYGSVKAGSHMPNLMYLTTFENKNARDDHWKSFSSDSTWKALSAMPEYKNNVSRSEILFLHPAEFSDI
jgi:hypothetical protein